MTSTAASTPQSAEAVRRAAVLTHGHPEQIGGALERLERVASGAGVELTYSAEEVEKHGLGGPASEPSDADIAVVLGGDGTMLRALARLLGSGVPVIGVNFGRVGFLAAIQPEGMEEGLERAFGGDYRVIELSTLEVEVGGDRHVAVNDVVVTSAILGRMVEIDWAVGGEELGRVPCDGVICSTPSGSTAYNLSNGGPVLVWGIDALAVTFIAPHSLHARPLVVPRTRDVVLRNHTAEVGVAVLADGHLVAESLSEGESVSVRLGAERTLLATLPESTFFTRYRDAFAA